MKVLLIALALASLLLTACAGIPAPQAENAATPLTQSTDVPAPTVPTTATSTSTTTAVRTPTHTPTPAPTDTPGPTATPRPTPVHPVGSIVKREPDNETAYKWFSYVPDGLPRDRMTYVLITAVSGYDYDYEESARTTQSDLRARLAWPHIDEFVLLSPVVPRRESPHVYPVGFCLNSFRESDDFYSRADLKINLLIDRLLSELSQDGYRVSEKVMIEGFSAGGMFAQRYAPLHPQRVKAIAAGACGGAYSQIASGSSAWTAPRG